jgi:hypothetical protein
MVLLMLGGVRVHAKSIRAEFTTSHPDRWLQITVFSRIDPAYPGKQAQHAVQSYATDPGNVRTDFANSYWITPTTPADPIVFVIDDVDPLEIIDFHIRVSAYLVSGSTDFTHPWVTGTLRLYEDGVLLTQRQARTRNCCDTVWASLPIIGTYPPDATPPSLRYAPDSSLSPSYRQIMNRVQTFGGYPSPYQERLIGSPSVPDLGGVIEVEVVLTGVDGSPAAAADVYANVSDPPDPAPYRTDRREGDNKGTAATVTGAPGYEVQAPGSTATVLRSDSAGKIYARLHGSKVEAGDNYRLRVSLYRPVPIADECSPNYMKAPCYESEVFTIWKRAVIENDRMLRNGTFLTADYSGGTTMTVVTVNAFKPAAGSALIFMRFPRGAEGFHSEIASIKSYKNGVITLNQPLTQAYQSPDTALSYTADAVAVWGAGFYDVNLNPLRDVFSEAMIDVHELPQAMPYFPYMNTMDVNMMGRMSNRWRQQSADAHLVAARYYSLQSFGTQTLDFSFVWVQQCIDYTSAADPLRNEVAAHEVVHRWDVNVAAGKPSDHCDLNAYANAAHRCSMHTYIQQSSTQAGSPVRTEFRDGVVQFHYVVSGTTADSEYLGLRSKDGVQ